MNHLEYLAPPAYTHTFICGAIARSLMVPISARGGTLYGCGMAKNESLPVCAADIDASGDCCFFAPIIFPVKPTPKVVAVAADMQVFAALTEERNLWGWGLQRSGFGQQPECLVQTNDVIDFDVGATSIVVIKASGKVLRFTKANPQIPIDISLPSPTCSPPTHISAALDTIAVVCADGSLWTMGPALNSGHGVNKPAFTQILNIPPMRYVSVGSRHCACVTADGDGVYVWGDGLSGNLGVGRRVSLLPTPTKCAMLGDMEGITVTHVSCTRGQPTTKRVVGKGGSISGGQEGPRTHVVTSDGGLWIAGSTHKGLAADHLFKVMQPQSDQLTFYRVGGSAADSCVRDGVLTGAAEDLTRGSNCKCVASREKIAVRMGMASADLLGKAGTTNYLTSSHIVASQPSHIHSWALSREGALFTWGCGSDGRTGLQAYLRGPGGSKRTLKCYVSTPSLVETLENNKVLDACAGRYWTFAIIDRQRPQPKEPTQPQSLSAQ